MSILKEHHAGLSATEMCRKHGINDATFDPVAKALQAVWKLRRRVIPAERLPTFCIFIDFGPNEPVLASRVIRTTSLVVFLTAGV